MAKKKKKPRFRVTKKDKSIHRKLLRREQEREQPSGIRIGKDRYLLATATIKRKLQGIASDIAFLLANAEVEDMDMRQVDLKNAREHCLFAWDSVNCSDFFVTPSPSAVPKRKLKRRKVKKLNRRKT